MDELVQRLSEGEHPVIAGRAESAEGLKESIDRGYVLIKFTETRGNRTWDSQTSAAVSEQNIAAEGGD